MILESGLGYGWFFMQRRVDWYGTILLGWEFNFPVIVLFLKIAYLVHLKNARVIQEKVFQL